MPEDTSATDKPAENDASTTAVIREKVRGSTLVPIVTALVLIALFCMYYFVYVRARREYLTNRNFRSLAILGDQIQTTVTNYGSVLTIFADSFYTGNKRGEHGRTKKGLTAFLGRADPEEAEDAAPRRHRYLQYLAPSFHLTEIAHGTPHGSMLQVQRRNGRWEMVLTAPAPEGPHIDFIGSVALEDALRPFVGSLPFNDILLASENGSIIYEKTKSGPQFTNLASLLGNQTSSSAKQGSAESDSSSAPETGGASNKDQTSHVRSVHLSEVMLAGTRYKVFLQPILIDVYSRKTGADQPAREWVLCGLISTGTLEWESLAISYTVIIWIAALFLMICLSGPMLKIFFLNKRERLRLREVAFLGLFLVLLCGVLTLSGLQWFYFHRSDDDTEERLEHMATSLSLNIRTELRQMLAQLQAMCATPELEQDLRDAATQEVIRKVPQHSTDAKTLTPEPRAYPYLSNVFWADYDGHQIVKWSLNDFVTPMVDISQEPFYRHLKTNQGHPLYLDGMDPPFDFDSVLPTNRLDYLAVLGMSMTACNPNVVKAGGLKEEVTNGSAFLVARPLSLIDPILPNGYGFALVDRSGRVLFNTDKTKNLRENFHQESDQNRELYAAMFGHSNPRSLRITYMGKNYRARVVPIPNLVQAPWSLIVYRELTPVRTVNLQAMTMASTLFLMILALPVIAMTIWWAARRPRYAPEWLLPHKDRLATYGYQIAVYAGLIVLSLLLAFHGSSEVSIVACALIPYAALLLTFWCYRLGAAKAMEHHQMGRLPAPAILTGGFNAAGNYRFRYGVSVLLLLLLIGVLTPMALFRATLKVERRLRMKHDQLELATAVERRQALVRFQCDTGERGAAECAESGDSASKAPDTWSQDALAPLDAATWRMVSHSSADPAHDGAGELYSTWFRNLIYALHHDYNIPAAEMLGLIADRSSTPAATQFSEWEWRNEGPKLVLRKHGSQPPGKGRAGESDLVVESLLPAYSWHDGWIALGVASGVMLLVGGLCWGLARKMFLSQILPLKITGARRVGQALREGRNVLVLLPHVSDWELEEPKWTVQLPALATGPKWAEELDLNSIPVNTVIEIRQFEYLSNDPEVDKQKFVLVERLVARERTQVAVVLCAGASHVEYDRLFPGFEVVDLREEPFSWLEEYEGPARDLIWNECAPMPALWPIGAQLARDIRRATDSEKENTHTRDSVAAEILERADAYYRMVWNESSKEQRFVLAQLAADGVPNPKNDRAIRQLMRRGLIVREPHFRIMNESFRRFLLSAATPAVQQEWHLESRKSGWGRIRGAFVVVMIVVGAFLLTTQNQLWQSSAAYVTTAFGAFGTLFKLFNSFRGGNTEKNS